MPPMNLDNLDNGHTSIKIAGETVEINATDPIKETLKRILAAKGIDSFTILIDGEEVTSTSDMPDTFADCNAVEVQRYVKPGR